MTDWNTYDPTLVPRTTVYKGVVMRSRLEARFASGLDKLGVPWEYEPRAYASDKGQYLPDFSIDDGHKHPYFIEVKPTIEASATEAMLRKMMLIWESEPGARLALVSPVLGNWAVFASIARYALARWMRINQDGFVVTTLMPPVVVHRKQWNGTDDEAINFLATFAEDVANGSEYLPFDWSWSA